jgi:signal transduction histidine kinase
MFTWSLLDIISLIFFFFSYYFLYTFVKEKDLPLWQKVVAFGILLPPIYWTLMGVNINTFYTPYCEAIENEAVSQYDSYAQLTFLIAIVIFAVYEFFKAKTKELRSKISLATIGVILFLFTFFFAAFLADFFVTRAIWEHAYNVEIYGLFGMPIMLAYLGYLIVRYKAFDVRVFTAQALVILLITVSASLFAVLEDRASIIINFISLLLSSILGIYLARNVKREIEQREQIETLAENLKTANHRLEKLNLEKTEFISLATHQIRAPLSAIKGYASLILEGDYGDTSEEIKDAVSTMYSSAHNLVGVVGDYLDISRLDLNRMKFNFSDVDLKQTLSEIVKEQQPNLRGKGLELLWQPEESLAKAVISADIGKIKQVISNLIDNAIKYTPKGSITLSLAHAAKLEKGTAGYRITIQDTGIGLNAETIPKLFKRFSRADSAHEVNVHGTGLGLYLARKMVEAHSGKIWAESDGEGNGSRFIIELPVKAELKENSLAEGTEGEEGK